MNVDCQSLIARLGTFALVKECDTGRDGSLRLATPFLYPDGSQIDVFYQESGDLFGSARLTDAGQTAAFLADLHIYIDKANERREEILTDVCHALNIRNDHGELSVLIEPANDLADGIVRLAQACIRVADILYTHNFRRQTNFHEVFALFVTANRPDYIEDFYIEGRFGRRIAIDFYTRQHRGPDNLIITLSSANQASSHSVANDVFCRWYDLNRYREQYHFLTVLDSTSGKFRAADINRVSSLSQVLGYPADAELLQTILAA